MKQATLSVSGKNIASVAPLDDDPAAGDGRVWLVELHGKVEDKYTLTCFYQQPYDPTSGGVTIHSFDALGAARQPAARLVVTGGGRVQVEPRGAVDGLKVEDARSLPDTFGAGDLSGAIRCYRALRGDYRCDLSVVRHSAADVLPASVEQARAERGQLDGVMMGRAAYQEPWRLLSVDAAFYGEAPAFATPKQAALALVPYIEREMAKGVRLNSITRHVLGLFRAVPGARAFRRHLSVEAVKPAASAQVLADALALVPDTLGEVRHIAA